MPHCTRPDTLALSPERIRHNQETPLPRGWVRCPACQETLSTWPQLPKACVSCGYSLVP